MIDIEKSVYIDVSTFDSLKNKGDIVISIINEVLQGAIVPLNYKMSVFVEKFNGTSRTFKFNSENWGKISNMLVNGEIRHFLINYVRYKELYQPEFAVSFTCDYAYGGYLPDSISVANNMSVSYNLRLFNGSVPNDIQVLMKDFFVKSFNKLNGIVGYIQLDYGHATVAPNLTRLENELGYYGFIQISNSFGEKARGGLWGNILTSNHIEKLGGVQKIKENAPCILMEGFKINGQRDAVYLQLTEDINTCDDETYKKLKNYLKPILPTGFTG